MEEKNLQLDRLVFFSDAVIAIAITLLALDIRLDHTESGHLHFSDLKVEWPVFAAFVLSFINIAGFWRLHHTFFSYIKQIDHKLLFYNICWLFFIVLLPFTTSLVSAYFSDTAAIFIYSVDILLISIFQNNIWDYASRKKDFIREEILTERMKKRLELSCNLDMINAVVAIGVSFFNPVLAFVLLFFKVPIFIGLSLFFMNPKYRKSRREENRKI